MRKEGHGRREPRRQTFHFYVLRYESQLYALCDVRISIHAKPNPLIYQPVKSNHPGSQNIKHSGPFMSPAVTTIGHREKSKTLPSTKDKSHDGDAIHYMVI